MAWIRTVSVEEARGKLGEIYEAAVARAGRVYQIVRAMSVSPRIAEASLGLYLRVLFAPEGLTRRQREMIAVAVSRANQCHY